MERRLGTGILRSRQHVDGLRMYFRRAHEFPLLTKDQEQLLFKAYEKEKKEKETKSRRRGSIAPPSAFDEIKSDPEFLSTISPDKQEKFSRVFEESNCVMDVIALCNLFLVASIARTWGGDKIPYEDKIQAGYLGLLDAISHFDYTRGYKFSTYATDRIANGISEAISEIGYPVHLTKSMIGEINLAKRAREDFENKYGRPPSEEEWIDAFVNRSRSKNPNQTRMRARGAIKTLTSGVSYGGSLNIENSDTGQELGDQLPDRDADTEIDVLKNLDTARAREALSKLSEEERNILILYFWQDMTQAQIATELGLATSNIGEKYRRALKKLRESLKSN